jgi:predicted neuraminidase
VVARADVFSTAPFAEAHASTIVAAAGGLVCAWFGGTREGAPDVAVWLATAGPGGSFGPPRRVAVAADGRGAPVACWNPVLHRLSDGRLLLFWREGPSPRRWSSQLAVSRDDGSTWGAAEALPAGFLGPIRSKPLTLADGTLLCPSSTETLGWRAHIERHDPRTGGWTFVQHLNRPWAMLAIQPTLLDHGRGRLQALCRTRHGVIAESWSEDGGGRWSPLRLTALANPNSAIDAVTLADGRHALVYNPSARARTPLVLALADDGRSWRDVATLDDGQGELSYPAVVQAPDGLLHVTWTWRRRRIRHAVVAL